MAYKVVGNWTKAYNPPTFPALNEVTIEECDLIDGHGTVYRDGAQRVKSPQHRTKVFKGEMAHSDAIRIAGDWQSEINHSKPRW